MFPKFHENQGPVTYFFNLLQTQGPNSSSCKIYNNYVSNTDFSLNDHDSMFIVS